MANELKDVLRIVGTEAAVLAAVRERQLGMANDSPYRLVAKQTGGAVHYYASDDGDRTQTGAIIIAKTNTQLVLKYDSTHVCALAVDANGDILLTPTRNISLVSGAITVGASGLVVNEGSDSTTDLRAEGNTYDALLNAVASEDRVYVGNTVGNHEDGRLAVVQSNNAAAIPGITINQADQSEGFIDFVGSNRGIQTIPNCSSASIRVEVNGTVYLIPLIADA